ncbi:MAG: hypothetical protein ACI38A_06175 [Candidatus Ornithomonoglobus sp.]
MKRKLISLITSFGMAASLAAALPLSAQAEEEVTINNQTYTESTVLQGGAVYTKCTFKGSADPDNPVIITVPEEGIRIGATGYSYGINVSGGYVTFTGGTISVVYGYYYTVQIESGAVLNLKDIKLQGTGAEENTDANRTPLIDVQSGGVLNIEEGAALTGNYNSNGPGGAVYNNGTVNMRGGIVYNNKSINVGGAVSNYGTFNMYGGEIYENSASSGGGIYNYTAGVINMYGGKIHDNGSSGIYGYAYGAANTLNMYGGEIFGHTSGIYLGTTSTLNMRGGTVYGNTTYSIQSVSTQTNYLSGGLILGKVYDYKSTLTYGTDAYPMYNGTIKGLPSDTTVTITDKKTGEVIPEARNAEVLLANIDNEITAAGADGTAYIGTYTEGIWYFGDAPVLSTEADAGYYSEVRASGEKEGIIAFNSLFENLADCKDSVTGYGIYIYGSNVENKVQLNAGTLEELAEKAGAFHATVENISEDKFDTVFTAMPYAVLNGSTTVTGDACVYTVNRGGKWLGAKPE